MFWDSIQMVLALIIIIFLANITLKKLGSFQKSTGQVIQIIERVSVSKTSSLCIVSVGSDYMLMSISETSSEVIQIFTEDEKKSIDETLAKKHTRVKSSELLHSVKEHTLFKEHMNKLQTLKKDYHLFDKKEIDK